MINFKAYASSSSGNLYTVDDGARSKIMLECGLPWRKVREALKFQTSSIDGVLLTHSHKDHSRSIADAMKAGLDCYMSAGTAEALSLKAKPGQLRDNTERLYHHRLHIVEPMKQFTLGSWTVLPFDTRHDDLDALGYLLVNRGGEKLLFVSDSFYVPYRFTDLTVIAVECNYSLDILNANVASGLVDRELKKRIMRSHASLQTVKDFLKANDLSKVEAIHLLHLSSDNSDEERFKREVMEIAGKPVYIA